MSSHIHSYDLFYVLYSFTFDFISSFFPSFFFFLSFYVLHSYFDSFVVILVARGLRMLSLVLGSEITDASVAAITSSYTNLELLDLSG